MKKTYESPAAYAEEFEANEYVAACWRVGCLNNTTRDQPVTNAPYGNLWTGREGPMDGKFNHNGDCRTASNNYFRGDMQNLEFVYEQSSVSSDLKGGVDNVVDVDNNGVISSGDVIYWHTNTDDPDPVSGYIVRWNHWGYVQGPGSDHPNRS